MANIRRLILVEVAIATKIAVAARGHIFLPPQGIFTMTQTWYTEIDNPGGGRHAANKAIRGTQDSNREQRGADECVSGANG